MQLIFGFMETDDAKAQTALVWEALDPEEQASLVGMLARLMVKALDLEEDRDE